MAIYHFEGKVISRSSGRSSVAASAYRSCERLVDERTGEPHDFTQKLPDLVESAILLPQGAPKRFANRQTLWNEVEAIEKRKDAQLAREFNIALPREFTEAQNWALAKEFVQKEFVDRGMIADMAYHRGHKSQEGQPHVHVMLTMREVTPEGFGQKVRSWNDKGLLLDWREAWADLCNTKFVEYGFDMRIDHRTLEAQGIDLEPQTKIGAKAAWDHSARMEEHQAKARENGERILKNPYIVLDALSKQQSTFTRHDVAKALNRYTADAEQFDQAFSKVMAHTNLIHLGQDDLKHDRYTTREMLDIEKTLVTHAMETAKRNNHQVKPGVVMDIAQKTQLKDQHLAAFEYLMAPGDVKNLVGVAGSGKSCLLDAVRQAHEETGHRVIGMTLAGKAAEGLQESSGIVSRTVASYINAWDNGFEQVQRNDVIVIDEAAMLDSRQLGRIMSEAHTHGAKVVSAFDVEQLQAIGAGAPARAIAERTGYAELSVVRRQKVEWQRDASQHFAMGETEKGLLAYERHECVHAYNTKQDAIQGMLERWEEVRSSSPDKTQLMLAYENKDVKQLNASARELMKAAGELEHGQVVQSAKGKLEVAPGERIYFLKNDYRDLDVRNGTLGTIEKVAGDVISVKVDPTERKPERVVTFDLKNYNSIDYGYAATVHKSQGATVDYSQYLPSPYADRHASYSAMTRHRLNADIHYSRDTFPNFADAAKKMSRENTKDFTLDYIEIRGLEAKEEFKNIRREVAYTPVERQEIQVQMKSAEERIRERMFDRELERIGKNNNMTFNRDISIGDKGVYRGVVEVQGQKFGMLDQGKNVFKIIDRDMLENPKPGKMMEITSKLDKHGHEHMRGVDHEMEKARTQSKGLDKTMQPQQKNLGGFEIGER